MRPTPPDSFESALRHAETWDAIEIERARAEITGALFDTRPSPVVLGRYVVLERRGRGSTGVVYGAWDPELRRNVAIKVLHPSIDQHHQTEANRRLLDEARALASLAHPHVVAIHDVGVIADEHPRFAPGVFLVMELLDGETLDRWVAGRPRPWREVLELMLPIARALEAAHAAGLTHRDVKLGNMLRGRDGRPQLVDFGLACAQALDDEAAPTEPDPRRAAGIVGTPSTMAPEQHLGRPADARTDQYGLCASLHHALHGRPPFAAEDLATLLRVKQTQVPTMVSTRVPSWLTAIVSRGLAPAPGDRFADMRELIAALEHGRGRGRRRLFAAFGVAALAGALLAGRAAAGPGPAERCVSEGERRIAEVWNPEIRTRMHDGLVATGRSEADGVARVVDSVLDEHMQAWRTARETACVSLGEATAEAHRETDAVACLDDILGELGEVTLLLGNADAEVEQGAIDVAHGLSAPSDCLGYPSEQPRTRELSVLLRRAQILMHAGKLDDSVALLHEIVAGGTAQGDTLAVAGAKTVECRIALSRSERRVAEQICDEALIAAEGAGDDRLATIATLRLAVTIRDTDQALRLIRMAEARHAALPHPDLWVRAQLDSAHARVLELDNRFEEALAITERSLAELEAAKGPDAIDIVLPLNAMAGMQTRLGRERQAVASYRRALAIQERGYGPDDLDVARLLNNIGGVEVSLGEFASAAEALERSLRIKAAAMGESSPGITNTLTRLARARLGLGQPQAALAAAERARAIDAAHATPGDSQPLAMSETRLAFVYEALDRCDEAIATAQRARAHLSPTDRDQTRAEISIILGRCLAARGDTDTARTELMAAITGLEGMYGPWSRDLVPAIESLAALEAGVGRPWLERAWLVRAAAICAARDGDPAEQARIETALARTCVLDCGRADASGPRPRG